MAVTAPFASIYAKINKRRFIFSFVIIRLNIRRCKITKNFLKGANSVAKRAGFCYNIKARGIFPALRIRGARYSLPPRLLSRRVKIAIFLRVWRNWQTR